MRRTWICRATTKQAVQWVEASAGNLRGLSLIGSSPGLVWAHGLGGSCASDDARGISNVLDPRRLNRSVLRLDLRGHGRSAAAHDPSRGTEQYTWPELARDYRQAAAASLSRAFFGGEAMGAAVALDAAVAASVSGSSDAPPGLVLMRPPAALAQLMRDGSIDAAWKDQLEKAASALDDDGFAGLESFETSSSYSLLDGAAAVYNTVSAADVAHELREQRRVSIDCKVLAAAIRGHASSQPPGREMVQRLAQKGQKQQSMAADAYGVPLNPGCPVLLLAVAGDSQHPVDAAEELLSLLPGSELDVAPSLEHAHSSWAKRIDAFLRKAWMKEFLTKRVMPQ